MRNFMEMLKALWAEGKFVCVGLDSEVDKIPKYCHRPNDLFGTISAFNAGIVEATKAVTLSYKPNLAFYWPHGSAGVAALRETIRHIHSYASAIPVILDCKIGDIGNTNQGHLQAIFDYFEADAVTVHPYMGHEAMAPFLNRADKGIFVLCRTSNPGAGELQDLSTCDFPDSIEFALFERIAFNVAERWNNYSGNCGLVIGATCPEELKQVRRQAPQLPLLIPGIGAQGGGLEATLRSGLDSNGTGVIINSSRGIIFASEGTDYAEAAGRAAKDLDDQITRIRQEMILNG